MNNMNFLGERVGPMLLIATFFVRIFAAPISFTAAQNPHNAPPNSPSAVTLRAPSSSSVHFSALIPQDNHPTIQRPRILTPGFVSDQLPMLRVSALPLVLHPSSFSTTLFHPPA